MALTIPNAVSGKKKVVVVQNAVSQSQSQSNQMQTFVINTPTPNYQVPLQSVAPVYAPQPHPAPQFHPHLAPNPEINPAPYPAAHAPSKPAPQNTAYVVAEHPPTYTP